MCLPAGARESSNRVGWTKRTNGSVVDGAALVRRLGGRDLLHGPAEVHRRGPGALARGPRHGSIQCPVELVRGGAVAVAEERATVTGRKRVAREARDLMRPEVEHDDARVAHLVEALHRRPGHQLAAERLQAAGQRVGQALRAAAHDGPPHGMPRHRHEDARTPRCPPRRATRKEWAALPPKSARARSPRRRRATAVADRSAWRPNRAISNGMVRDPERRGEHVLRHRVPVRYERPVEPAPAVAPGAQAGRGRIERSLEHDSGAVIERMGERGGRLDPLQAVVGERQRPEDGRGQGERMARRRRRRG